MTGRTSIVYQRIGVAGGGSGDWGERTPSCQRLFSTEPTEDRGKSSKEYAAFEFGEAVGRATRGMDREEARARVASCRIGHSCACLLAIHVPAEGRRPTAGPATLLSVNSA